MKFDSKAYGPAVAAILALDSDGERLMPLAPDGCSCSEALARIKTAAPEDLFPNSRAPHAALSGLFLYFSCLDESHQVAQSIQTPDGAYWHGIMHRQEPDPANARYWFRQVGSHPIFSELASAARTIRLPDHEKDRWDPIRFVETCERARLEPDSPLARMALEVQRAEWQLLFDFCARARSGAP